MTRKLALFELNLATALFGLSGILAAQMTVHPVVIVWGRCLFAALALSLFMRLIGFNPWRGRNREQLIRLALVTGILTSHWICFFLAVYHGGVVLATLGFASFPAFVIILNSLAVRKVPSLIDSLIITLISIGLVLVTPPLDSQNSASLSGLFWGLVSGLLYAALLLVNRRLTGDIPSLALCWWQCVMVICLLLPFVAPDLEEISQRDWLWLMLAGLLSTAVAYSLLMSSLPHLTVRDAAVISSLEPVYAVLMAATLLGEIPGLKTLTGAAIIVGTAAWSSIKKAS